MTSTAVLPIRCGIVVVLGLLAIGAAASPHDLAQDSKPAADGFASNGVVAFQGNSSEFPGNTLAAIESALELGVGWVQVDVQTTKDGVLILLRPVTIKRDGKVVEVDELEHAAFDDHDVAEKFRETNRKTLKNCPAMSAPTLNKVLARMKAQKRSRLLIRPIGETVDAITAMVKEQGAARWVGFNSGDLRALKALEAALPKAPRFWDRPPRRVLAADLAQIEEEGCALEAMTVRDDGVNRKFIDQAHQGGLKIGAWNVKGVRGRMTSLEQWGCDYVYTAYPRLAMKTFAR